MTEDFSNRTGRRVKTILVMFTWNGAVLREPEIMFLLVKALA